MPCSRSVDVRLTDSMGLLERADDGAHLANRPEAGEIDREIAELGGITTAHSDWMNNAVRDLKELDEEIHRLRREERYFRSMAEALMPALPLISYHANGLSHSVKKCHKRLEQSQVTDSARDNEAGCSGKATSGIAKSWKQNCMPFQGKTRRK